MEAVALDGNLTRVSRLRARGFRRAEIDDVVAQGQLSRICRDWVGTTGASQNAVVAVAQGGRLTGPTALASLGLWDALDRRVHVQVPTNYHPRTVKLRVPVGAFTPPRYPNSGFSRHWMDLVSPAPIDTPPWRAPIVDALVIVSRMAPPEQFIACVDSALHHDAIPPAMLPTLRAALTREQRGLLAEIDPAAESGLESITRFLVRPFVSTIRSQVEFPGISKHGGRGRVDLLLDEWLVVELDGDEFHDPVADRKRDAVLVQLGLRIHRFGHDQVTRNWPSVQRTIQALLDVPPLTRRQEDMRHRRSPILPSR